MSFRLVPKSVTLNDLERRNGVILRCFSKFGYLPGALRKSSRSLSHLLMSSCHRLASRHMPKAYFTIYIGLTLESSWCNVPFQGILKQREFFSFQLSRNLSLSYTASKQTGNN